MSDTNDEFDDMLADASDELEDGEEELDLSEEGPERNFEPFRGNFEAVVFKTESTRAASSNAKMVKVEAIVTEEGEHKNQHLWFNLMLGGKGLWFLKAFLKAIDVEFDRDRPTVKPAEWEGAGFIAVCGIKPARGEYDAKTEVKNFKAIEGESTSDLQ